MTTIRSCPLPADALLSKYTGTEAFTDCYTTEVAAPVSHAQFVEAFYTGRVFRIERWLIKLLLSKASTDAHVTQLAKGEANEFAAWRVEGRAPNQLLLCDISGRTRSWLMVSHNGAGTRLYFGSAVVPRVDRATGKAEMGPLFKPLLGFHKLYSRVLLGAARDRLAPQA